MQRKYEVMFIIRPDLTEEEADRLVSTIETNAATAGAKVVSAEKMGKRRLAYMVRRFNDGNYVLLKLEADGNAIHEVERRLRVSEPVLKFITVRTDERMKRVEKLAKLRSQKVKRSAVEAAAAANAANAAAAAAAAATPAPETPGA
ncbi:MAG: 30S ribosomal protein S6 [Acidobacteriales bacterium]|nr:30S ribosomal protein S6 [Terriglobales bacterium]